MWSMCKAFTRERNKLKIMCVFFSLGQKLKGKQFYDFSGQVFCEEDYLVCGLVLFINYFLHSNLEGKSAFNASFFSSIPVSSTLQRFAHPVDI